jgi:hypothetical protein
MSEAKPLTAGRNQEALLQIEYLEQKFQPETGMCEKVMARLRAEMQETKW